MDDVWQYWGHTVFYALVGAFGTALVHEKTSRDVSLGGWVGLLLGGVFGITSLISFWVWLIYDQRTWRVSIQNPRRRWFTWWMP